MLFHVRIPCSSRTCITRVGIFLAFFLVGLTIKVGDVAGAALNMRLNLLTQAFSLGVLPAVGLGLAGILTAGGMNSALANGVLILVSRGHAVTGKLVYTSRVGVVWRKKVMKYSTVSPTSPDQFVNQIDAFCCGGAGITGKIVKLLHIIFGKITPVTSN